MQNELRRSVPVSLLILLPVRTFNAAEPGETFYNGIVLPREWPPRLADFPTSIKKDPITPPYLTSPPAVIPIDVGRQLFVDDILIAETTLKPAFHLAKYHPANPVLKPDQPWEMKNPDHAAAMVFSDGVWYDPKDELFYYFYVSRRTGRPGNNKAGTLSTGLATLRRDGFAAMDADEHGGTPTTRPVRFSGRHLFINLDNPRASISSGNTKPLKSPNNISLA